MRVQLAWASAAYEEALREIEAAKEMICKAGGANPGLQRQLRKAEDRAAQAALRIAELRGRA